MKGVIGIIEREKKLLFGIETKNTPLKGKWRLLGGTVEKGENSTEAMIREALEEAKIKVEIIDYLGQTKGNLKEITLDLVYSKWISGELVAKIDEIDNLTWFNLREAKELNKEPASIYTLELYEKYLENKKEEEKKIN